MVGIQRQRAARAEGESGADRQVAALGGQGQAGGDIGRLVEGEGARGGDGVVGRLELAEFVAEVADLGFQRAQRRLAGEDADVSRLDRRNGEDLAAERQPIGVAGAADRARPGEGEGLADLDVGPHFCRGGEGLVEIAVGAGRGRSASLRSARKEINPGADRGRAVRIDRKPGDCDHAGVEEALEVGVEAGPRRPHRRIEAGGQGPLKLGGGRAAKPRGGAVVVGGAQRAIVDVIADEAGVDRRRTVATAGAGRGPGVEGVNPAGGVGLADRARGLLGAGKGADGVLGEDLKGLVVDDEAGRARGVGLADGPVVVADEAAHEGRIAAGAGVHRHIAGGGGLGDHPCGFVLADQAAGHAAVVVGADRS